jgi:protein ImuA
VEWNDWHVRVWRGTAAVVARAVVPTGFSELDRILPGGGWPLGAITEIFVDDYGSGELALLMPALAALTKAEPRKWVAWIAPPFLPYAPALQQHGVDIGRLLMIHPTQGVKSRFWAIEQVVRSGSSMGVLAWVPAAEAETDARGRAALGAVAADVMLRRLQLAAEEHECWVVLFRPARLRLERSPAALRIRVLQMPAGTRVEILKCRGGRPGVADLATGFAPAGACPAEDSRW